LLGVTPPRLSSRHIVKAGALFGVSEGTTRVALSRMSRAGELAADNGYYELTGRLLDRYERQHESRSPQAGDWSGEWSLLTVRTGRREAEDRADLRTAMGVLRYGELRPGVWTRPDNLDAARSPEAWGTALVQCRAFSARPDDPAELCTELWDLPGWDVEAERLRGEMAPLIPRLVDSDATALAGAFVVAAAVMRHLLADPLLPAALRPEASPGAALRSDYDRYETAFKSLWKDFFSEQGQSTSLRE
jgi:phenylacetic acid degradation operon negative regulatory protein